MSSRALPFIFHFEFISTTSGHIYEEAAFNQVGLTGPGQICEKGSSSSLVSVLILADALTQQAVPKGRFPGFSFCFCLESSEISAGMLLSLHVLLGDSSRRQQDREVGQLRGSLGGFTLTFLFPILSHHPKNIPRICVCVCGGGGGGEMKISFSLQISLKPFLNSKKRSVWGCILGGILEHLV